MTDDELNTPIPVNQSAGPPAADARSSPSVAEMPSPAVEDGDSAVAGKGQPRKRRKPKIMQFGKRAEASGEPQPVVLDVPEVDDAPKRRRRGKKITPDQAVKIFQVPFHGMAELTHAAMWEVDAAECEFFKDQLAECFEEISRLAGDKSGGKLAEYFPWVVAGAGVGFISLTRLYGYLQLVKIAKELEKQMAAGPAMSHPPGSMADHANPDNGFDSTQAEKLIAAMMGQ